MSSEGLNNFDICRRLKLCQIIMHYYAIEQKKFFLQEEKATFDGMFKQFQQIFTLSTERNGGNLEFNKGNNVESAEMGNGNEIKTLC